MKSTHLVYLLCCLECFVTVNSVIIDYNNPTVVTSYGSVKGRTLDGISSINRRYVQFIGVPYARPPTGSDRFQPPSPPDQWRDVRDASNNRVMCPQIEQRFNFQLTQQIREDEDCLYMNVYVPVPQQAQFSQSLPVIVYIHGGEFKWGGKDLYKPNYVLESAPDPGVILVTINYRLGVLGFLSTDDMSSPGNNGLRDQAMALQFVAENIQAFNGNPQNVTIFGHDAGAISVSMQILNHDAWPFFQNAISIGGTVFTPWALASNPRQQAIDFGRNFNCDWQSDKLVECLRYQDLGSLIASQRNARDWNYNTDRFWFRPVVDRNVSHSAIFKDYPINLYRASDYSKVNYIAGFTTKAGSLEYYQQYEKIKNFPTNTEKLAHLIRPFLKEYAMEAVIASAINWHYFRNRTQRQLFGSGVNQFNRNNYPYNLNNYPYTNPQAPFQNPYQYPQQKEPATIVGKTLYGYHDENDLMVQAMSDFLYIAPTDMALRLHARGGARSYMFMLDYEGMKSFGMIQKYAVVTGSKQYGATHMDDMWYSMLNEYNPASLSGNDASVAKTYPQHLVAFAMKGGFGQLVGGGSWVGGGWLPFTDQQGHFARIERNAMFTYSTPQTLGGGYRAEELSFWTDFIFELQDLTARPPTIFPYEELKSFQAATWSMVAVVLLLVLILLALSAIILKSKRKEKKSLKLLRRQDRELEERHNGD